MRFKTTLIVLLIIAVFSVSSRMLLQTTQGQACPTPPTPSGAVGPWQNSIFTYYLTSTDQLLKIAVRESFDTWNFHNFNENCSNVSFVENFGLPPAPQGDYDLPVYTTYTLPGDPPDSPALTNCTWTSPLACQGKYAHIKCSIYFKWPSNSSLSNQGNYFTSFPTAVRKFAMHEIGHVMGLGHQPIPYVPGHSIMNNGTGTNDTGNIPPYVSSNGWLPWNPPAPQPCDNQGVRCETCPTPTPAPPQCYYRPVIIWDWVNNCLWKLYYREFICDGIVQFVEYIGYEIIYCGPQE